MIELPLSPGPRSAEPFLLDFGGHSVPPLGGRVQRVDRLGSRFGIQIEMPPMQIETARVFVRRLVAGKAEGVRIDYPLLGFEPGSPGAPVVNGAGQSGRTLDVRGLSASYLAKEGQFITHVHAGGRCLYVIDADTAATTTGTAAWPISPMLRVQPADGDVIEVAMPKIEGFVVGEEWRWQMALDRTFGIAFEIHEYE